MSLEIVQAKPADLDELLIILEEARRFKLAQGDVAWDTVTFTPPEVARTIAAGNTYIARLGAQAMGSVKLTWEDERMWGSELGRDGQAGYIHRLATRDAARGQEIGARMMGWACNQIDELGRPYARLDCDYQNRRLCEYYQDLGFDEISCRDLKNPDYTVALYQKAL